MNRAEKSFKGIDQQVFREPLLRRRMLKKAEIEGNLWTYKKILFRD